MFPHQMAAPIAPSYCSFPKTPNQMANCLDYEPARLAMFYGTDHHGRRGLVPDEDGKLIMEIFLGTVGVALVMMLIITIIQSCRYNKGRFSKKGGCTEGHNEQQGHHVQLQGIEIGRNVRESGLHGVDHSQPKAAEEWQSNGVEPGTLDRIAGMIMYANVSSPR